MLVRVLQHLDPFQQLRLPELQTVARHAQVLNLPAGRWLLRAPRKLSGAYYLLRGRLTLRQPPPSSGDPSSAALSLAARSAAIQPTVAQAAGIQRRLSAQDPGAVAAFYPGCIEAQAESAVQVLHINTAPIAFLWEVVQNASLQTALPDDAWLNRFLSSPMLQQLDPARWQQLLRGGSHEPVAAGAAIVRLGEPGQAFYVLKRGRALVQRAGQSLALLGPGDFFGEDALVTDTPRNATVTMQTSGELLVLPKQRFLQFLVAYVVGHQPVARTMVGTPLLLWVAEQAPPQLEAQNQPLAMIHIPLTSFRERLGELDFRGAYRVAGGSLSERALAILLLAQRGLQADYAQLVDAPSTSQRSALRRHGPIASPVAQLGDALGTHDRHGVSAMDGG